MARHKLTDTKIKAALKAGKDDKLGDGDGLWLYVQKSSTASWVFIRIRHGWRREMGLGSYRYVSLAAARNKAEEVRDILGRGGDPFKELPERIAAVKPKTFGECADDLLAAKESQFRNDKHKAQWKMTLTVYAKPLRKLPVADVSTDDVVRVLRPLWQDKQETASRLRGRIEKVLDYAKALKLRGGENPARWKGHLDHILGKREKLKRGHHAAIPYADMPAFMEKLRALGSISARALEFTILTAARTGETLGATWDEIDLEAKVWTVPANRMKAHKEHRVPLSDRAVEILKALPRGAGNPHLFCGARRGKGISNMAMLECLRDLAPGLTVHGFRSAFRDWAGDQTNFPRDIVEMALAHTIQSVEAAYRRGSALAKRRKLMEAWASYCATVKGSNNVLPMERRKGEVDHAAVH